MQKLLCNYGDEEVGDWPTICLGWKDGCACWKSTPRDADIECWINFQMIMYFIVNVAVSYFMI